MDPPPSPLARSLARTPLPAIYAEIRDHLATTSGKTLVGLLLCPVLVTLATRLCGVQHAREIMALWTRAKLDPLVHWYGVFALHFLLLFVIPVLCIKLGFKERLSEYGFQVRPVLRLWPVLLLFLLVMLPITYVSSLRPSFSTFYPLYRGSLESWQKFLLFEAGFLVMFFTQEFFFRGFLIEILKPKFGLNAILIASAIYGVAHFSKPLPEQLGAFVVGIVLGYIGDRYRTFVFGIIIHYLISFSMDAFLVVPALLRK